MEAADLLRALGLAAVAVVAATSCASKPSRDAQQPTSSTTTTTSVTDTTTAHAAQPNVAQASKPASFITVSEELKERCKLPNTAEAAPHFDYDSAKITSDGDDVLKRVAACLTDGPLRGAPLKVIGHADPRGSDQYNDKLALDRANAVKEELVSLGAPRAYVKVETRGKKDATGKDEASWALDRRVEIWLSHEAPKP